MVKKDKICMNKASQITSCSSKEWATLDSKQLEIQWRNIKWENLMKRVNKLQSRITKAT